MGKWGTPKWLWGLLDKLESWLRAPQPRWQRQLRKELERRRKQEDERDAGRDDRD